MHKWMELSWSSDLAGIFWPPEIVCQNKNSENLALRNPFCVIISFMCHIKKQYSNHTANLPQHLSSFWTTNDHKKYRSSLSENKNTIRVAQPSNICWYITTSSFEVTHSNRKSKCIFCKTLSASLENKTFED